MRIELKRGNDQIVRLSGLRLVANQNYLNNAEVKATLYDWKGAVVPSIHDVPLTYVLSSNGVYQWEINGPIMMLPPSTLYKLVVTAEEDDYDYRVVYDVTISD